MHNAIVQGSEVSRGDVLHDSFSLGSSAVGEANHTEIAHIIR